jgi:CRP-like cAMP-binding protein
MGYDIRQITNRTDYRAIAELRYAVYAAEEELDLPGMDHRRRTFRDAADADSLILGVFAGKEAIATIAVTPMSALGPENGLRRFFGSSNFPVDEARQAVIGRLMVASAYRGSPVCMQLFAAVSEYILRSGLSVGFVECNPRTIPLYESIGCRPCGKPAAHPAYGLVVPMAFVPDAEYLARIDSPLQALVRASAQRAELGRWFDANQAQAAAFASVRAMSCDSFDAATRALRAEGGPFFGLSAEACQRLLRLCSVLAIDAGATVLARGSVGTEMYVVAQGSVMTIGVHAEGRPISRLGTGDAFADGKFRWSGISSIGREAIAVEPTRLLAISDAAFANISRSRPAIAARLLASLETGREAHVPAGGVRAELSASPQIPKMRPASASGTGLPVACCR